jgi:hippurate hydrolase
MIKEQIQNLAASYSSEMIEVRHHLHRNPELSFKEFETSKFIQQQLAAIGIPYHVLANTGVVGIIKGRNADKRVVALRADIDALPITEENNIDYASQNTGVMHACGHDVHSACLLGAAKILNQLKHEWEGTVKLIFQPGEEKNPGGASLMIKEGVLQNPEPACIFALHVHPALEVGKLSFRSGKVMASADELYITITGEGGHAASPHLTVDTIFVAAQLIVNLQQIISRNNDPFNPSVLSITSVQGGNTTNVIPSQVTLMGTFRAMDEDWRLKAHDLIRTHCENLSKSSGAVIDVLIDIGYPFVLNDETLTNQAEALARHYLGDENVLETEIRMGAEDFSFYSHLIPACFYRLGVGNKTKGITNNVHTPKFDIDERAIEIGMGMMAFLGATA